MTMAKLSMTIKCTLSASHFDGHGGPPVRHEEHRLMHHVQDYTRSHWILPSGNYLLRIATVEARATGKQATMNKYTYFAGCFDGHGNALVRYPVHRPMEEVRGFTRSHWTPPLGKYYVQ